MPVTLEGSCHCGAVAYTLESHTPVPYQLCYCSICRKVGGYMGSVNIMGDNSTLKIVKGKEHLKSYQAVLKKDESGKVTQRTDSLRWFCSECSSMLWLHDETWKDWIYPFASSIDTPLPPLPGGTTMTVVMREGCPEYIPLPEGAKAYQKYAPGAGIEEWHKKNGAWVD